MTALSMQIESQTSNMPRYRAIAGNRQLTGRIAGEALDALNAQLGPTESGSLLIVQQLQSDLYFAEWQRATMTYL